MEPQSSELLIILFAAINFVAGDAVRFGGRRLTSYSPMHKAGSSSFLQILKSTDSA